MFDTHRYFEREYDKYTVDYATYLHDVQMYIQSLGRVILVDVGCGSGIFLRDMKRTCTDIAAIGLDISKNMLKLADKDNLLIMGSAEDLPLRVGIADVVYMSCLLHHLVKESYEDTLKNQANVLVEVSNILKKNGLLIIHELYYDFFNSLLNQFWFYMLKFFYRFGVSIPGQNRVIISLNARDTWANIFQNSFNIVKIDDHPLTKRSFKFRLAGVKKVGYIVSYLRREERTKLA